MLYSTKSLGWLALLVLGAAVLIWAEKAPLKPIQPLVPGSDPWRIQTFRDWAYYADPAEIPRGLENRGSRLDGVEYEGEFVSGWFRAEAKVGLMVAGFPSLPGNRLGLESRDGQGRLTVHPFDIIDPRDSWRPWTVKLPTDAVAFRVHAIDRTSGENGWLAVTQPFTPAWRPGLLPQAARAFWAFAFQAVLLVAIGLALARGIRRWIGENAEFSLLPLAAGAAVAIVGYLAFWIYFAHPLAGQIFSWAACMGAGLVLVRSSSAGATGRKLFRPVLLAGLIGVFYLGLTVMFESPRLSYTAARRFVDLPSDNEIPRAFGERLLEGKSPKQLWGDWLSSDRPPLQTGWLLLTWPVMQAAGFDADTLTTTGGICFQLLWVLAAWSLARHLGANSRQALAVVAAISFTGVMLLFSVFVWPKLAAAALVLGAVLIWLRAGPANARPACFAGGVCAALGWLAHGGVAFSLVGLAPLVLLFGKDFGPWRNWGFALAGFALLAAPWMAYQRFYEPPGNRLLKWHLAGAAGVDDRSFPTALTDGYSRVGVHGALANKWTNVQMQFRGDWKVAERRDEIRGWLTLKADEGTYFARALAWWLVAAMVPLWVLLKRTRRGDGGIRREGFMAAWVLTGLVAIVALLFEPNAATVHQGTLITQLVSLTLLAWWALAFNRWFFGGLVLLQCAWFFWVWVPFPGRDFGSLQPAVVGLTALAAVALGWTALRPARRAGEE